MELRRRGSPVRLDRIFTLRDHRVRRFLNLGFQSGNEGIQHTLFLPHALVRHELSASEPNRITGLCSYHYLYGHGTTVIQGLLFVTNRMKSRVNDYKLVVSNYERLPDEFIPCFDLERLGILYYTSADGSVLVLSSDVESRLLVKAN